MVASHPQVRITGEPASDATVCRFTVDPPVFPGGSFHCPDAEAAQGSTLLEALFAVPGIQQVHVAGSQVTVSKSGSEPWPVVGKAIGSAIRAHFASGSPFIPPPPRSTYGNLSAAEAAQAIREVLEQEINPSLASHGGSVELIELKGSSALLKMSGGCQGCGAAKITMKSGIERAIRARFPQITEIVDLTDHAAGKNPYY
ncbi:MAG TPA: NifU family protein [Bdellovibrionota bacterium]|nr:NifU family protein [Bdellovibrionota bacterium]